jgi:hypothetical protein
MLESLSVELRCRACARPAVPCLADWLAVWLSALRKTGTPVHLAVPAWLMSQHAAAASAVLALLAGHLTAGVLSCQSHCVAHNLSRTDP